MIALLGATGYTGRLVAEELARLGVEHRLGGRSPARLEPLGAAPGAGKTVVVDATDAGALDAFLAGASAVISCVGPFTQLGMPVVEAAVRNGVPYVDSTGETEFMADVYERFTSAAVPLVPACGFDYIPGDLAAAVAAAGISGKVRRVVVAYELSGVAPSRGTARTAVGAMRAAKVTSRSMRVRFPAGWRDVVEVPWGEQVTVPRHVPGASVAAGIVMPAVVAPALGVLSGALRVVAPVAERLVAYLPEGPTASQRRRSSFKVVAEAHGDGDAVASVVCEGSDIYGLTARFLVEAARRIGGAGGLTPAQALDPVPFLDAVTGEGPTGTFLWRRLG